MDGKVDAEGAEPKVLVDNITTDFKMTVSSNAPDNIRPSGKARGLQRGPDQAQQSARKSSVDDLRKPRRVRSKHESPG